MSLLWNLHLEKEKINEDNMRNLRIIEDLHRSIKYFNTKNIDSPKFGYTSSFCYQQRAFVQKSTPAAKSVNSEQSNRKSIRILRTDNQNQQSKQGNKIDEQRQFFDFICNKDSKQIKKMESLNNEENDLVSVHRKFKSRDKSIRTKTFTLRSIKGVVFRAKK